MSAEGLRSWLLGEGWTLPVEELVAGLVARLDEHGFRITRVFFAIPSLHPTWFADAVIWRRGVPTQRVQARHGFRQALEFQQSPLVPLLTRAVEELRFRLDRDYPEMPVLREFRAEGATDWLGLGLSFEGAPDPGLLSVQTDHPEGFDEARLGALRELARLLTRAVEGRSMRATAVNLLDTYVGRHAGERILRGKIQRGSVEIIHAAIAFCDLRGFTERSERLPPERLVETLNRFFDAMVPPLRARGAEVLKFMGDGLLAIVPAGEDPAPACAGLLEGAKSALAALAEARDAEGEPMRCGIALHMGPVAYGNIGSADRLDFTVIGPAVNLAARLEGLGKQLGEPIVLSEELALACGGPTRALGRFTLKGLVGERAVFAPAD